MVEGKLSSPGDLLIALTGHWKQLTGLCAEDLDRANQQTVVLLDGWSADGDGWGGSMSMQSSHEAEGHSETMSLVEFGYLVANLIVAAPQIDLCPRKCLSCSQCIVSSALAGHLTPTLAGIHTIYFSDRVGQHH